MQIKTRALIVGGGPAGATAASVLAMGGVDTVLLEKNFSFQKPCGGGIPSGGVEEFNIPEKCIVRKVQRARLVAPSGKTVDVDLTPDSLCIVDRKILDSFLRERAVTCGARLFEGYFVSAEKGKDYYTCRIRNGQETRLCKTEYIIAADGVNSRVRHSQGIKPVSSLFTITERLHGIDSDACEFWFSSSHADNFYSWVFPAEQGISVGTGARDPKLIKTLLKTFKLRRKIENFSSDTRIYKIPKWKNSFFNKGKILFAGDAAGQALPLSYEGIYYSMKSGEMAAKAVIKDTPALYKKIWRKNFYIMYALLARLNSYFLKNDRRAERLVAIHGNPVMQEAAKVLWVKKKYSASILQHYIKLLGKSVI